LEGRPSHPRLFVPALLYNGHELLLKGIFPDMHYKGGYEYGGSKHDQEEQDELLKSVQL